MEKGKFIGAGATADVYDWKENMVIKIFNDNEPYEAIEREINNTRALKECSFMYPRFIEKLRYKGRNAVVYEKVSGISMMKQLETDPYAYRRLAKKLAHIQFDIHKNHVDGIREQKKYFKDRISWSMDINDIQKAKLYSLIDSMPGGNHLCHSDFHPDNIISCSSGDYIIDWADCCSGNECADVARTVLTLKTANVPHDVPKIEQALIAFIRNRFCTIYLKEYLKISHKSIQQINEWYTAVAAYRLCAARGNEKIKVLEIINSYLNSVQ